MPDASAPNLETTPQATSVTSGGANLDAQHDVNVGGDAVGHDKIIQRENIDTGGGGVIKGNLTVESGGTFAGRDIVGFTAEQVRTLLEAAIATAHEQAPLAVAPTLDELDAHYDTIAAAFTDGSVVPFLGSGANLCGRPPDAQWQSQHYLPSGFELAEYLAKYSHYPAPNRLDLTRVAQYVAVMSGVGKLYDKLRPLFAADYSPTALHQLLAMIPSLLTAKGYPSCHQLIVTTNYDDLMERTFKSVGEPFDVVIYVADGDKRGKFVHWPHDSEPCLIETPNEYRDLPIEIPSCNLSRSIILKLHGAVDRANAERDSYVITEDHYIDYLARKEMSNPIPATLIAKLKRANFLFIGYSLRDWNLRVILQRIWTEQERSYASFAIQENAEALDRKFWGRHNVEILNVRLEDYVKQLTTRLGALPTVQVKP